MAIKLEIIGEYTPTASASIRSAIRDVQTLGREASAVAGDVTKKSAAERAALRELAAQFRATAASAVAGSDEQIAALDLAAKAEGRLALATQVSTRATGEQRAVLGSLGATARGLVGLGISYAGFEGLRSSLDTVLAAQAGIAQLDRAVTNAHASIDALDPVLEQHAARARELGFTDDETRAAEARLIQAFGATKGALGELSAAEDLARSKGEDLATAATQLILLQEGNTRAAKQFGLALPDLTAKQWRAKAAADGLTVAQERGKVLYDELLPRIHAQAQAYANSPSGKIAEFQAQVQHLQETVGQDLLPAVNHYLGAADEWLAKDENQKRVSQDVRKALSDVEAVLRTGKTVIGDIDKATGSFTHTLEILLGLSVLSKLNAWSAALGTKGLAGQEAIAAAQGQALANKLTVLSKFAASAIVIDVVTNYIDRHISESDKKQATSGPGSVPGFLQKVPLLGSLAVAGAGLGNRLADALGLPARSADLGPFGGLPAGLQASPADAVWALTHGSGKASSVFGPPLVTGGGGGGDGAAAAKAAADRMKSAVQDAADIASHWADLAKNLDNTGKTAKLDLEREINALEQERSLLEHEKQTPAVKKAITDLDNKIRDVQKQVADAIVITGLALIPATMKTKLSAQQRQFAADTDKAAALTGDTAAAYGSVLLDDLKGQARTLTSEETALKAKLASATGKQKTAIQTELDKVKSQLSDVQQQIVSNLQNAVQALQSKVSGLFTSVENELDAALGALYFQGGLLTPAEQQLAEMQAEDTAKSLNDQLAAAQKQLADDTTGAIIGTIVDQATGTIKNVYGAKGSADQLATDQAAIDAAQRAITENNLQIEATKERTQADTTYAAKVQSLNSQIDALAAKVENGTGSISDLDTIAQSFGLTITSDAIPDFSDLSTASGDLKAAFADLAAYIKSVTGSQPAPTPTPTDITPPGGDTKQSAAAQATEKIGGNLYAVLPSGGLAFLSGSVADAVALASKTHVPIAMADGGRIPPKFGGTLIRAAEAGEAEYLLPERKLRAMFGGRGDSLVVHFTVNAPGVVDTRGLEQMLLSPRMRATLAGAIKGAKRGGNLRASDLPVA